MITPCSLANSHQLLVCICCPASCLQQTFAVCVQRAARLEKLCAITFSEAQGCHHCHSFRWISDSQKLRMSILNVPLLLPDGSLVRDLVAGITGMYPQALSGAGCCNAEDDVSWTGHLMQELPPHAHHPSHALHDRGSAANCCLSGANASLLYTDLFNFHSMFCFHQRFCIHCASVLHYGS